MKEINALCDKVGNDFISICQGQKVCVSMKYSVMRIFLQKMIQMSSTISLLDFGMEFQC